MSRLWAVLVLALCSANARPPSTAAGDTVVVFESAKAGGEDVDIMGQRLSADGKPLWGGGKPIGLCTADAVESAPAICEDGVGGVIVAYQYRFVSGANAGDTDIVAQRFGPDGKAVWGDAPRPVGASRNAETRPVVLGDGRGGAFVVYEWRDDKGDTDLLAQRVSANGKTLWNGGDKPTTVASSRGAETGACVVSDGAGGIIVCFDWSTDSGQADVMAERVSGDGRLLWEKDEKARDIAASSHIERHVVAVPDGHGGVIAAYEIEFTSGEYKGDTDIMAQRLGPDGKAMWESDGMVVSSGTGIERNPFAVSDGAGGAIVCVEYEPTSGDNKGDVDILAQRLGPDGKMLWAEGKNSVPVGSSRNLDRNPMAVRDGQGGVLVVFETELTSGEHKGDVDLLAQRLGADGKMVWEKGERSATVSTSIWRETGPIVASDGEGGAVVVFSMEGTTAAQKGDLDIGGVRLNGDGKLLWENGERSANVADSPALERSPRAVTIGGSR